MAKGPDRRAWLPGLRHIHRRRAHTTQGNAVVVPANGQDQARRHLQVRRHRRKPAAGPSMCTSAWRCRHARLITIHTVLVTRARRVATVRLAVGLVMIAMPRLVLRLAAREITGAEVLLTRTIGIRDAVLGAGGMAALRSDDYQAARTWIVAGLTSDVMDTVAGLFSARWVGGKAAFLATSLGAQMTAADVWALTRPPTTERRSSI